MLRKLAVLAAWAVSLAQARGVHVSFDPTNARIGPFPTDFLTTQDAQQRTGMRVALPLPDCSVEPSTCAELGIINTFDGFSLQPRIRVKFSGPINPDTLRGGIYFVWKEQLNLNESPLAPVNFTTPINEVVYDPDTHTAFAKPDAIFDQDRRYLIVVTDSVRDMSGDPVESDEPFRACLDRKIGGDYCIRLSAEVNALPQTSEANSPKVVGASLFTTMSATSFMESARQSLSVTNPSFTRTGSTPIFDVNSLSKIELNYQVRTSGDKFQTVDFPISLSLLAQVGLGRIAFGSFHSPRFIGDKYFIPPVPTATSVQTPIATEEIFFQVFLPAKPAPSTGYPVAIVGHGIGSNRFAESVGVIPGLVSAGIAVVGMNLVGHGFGPEGTVVLTSSAGNTATLPAGGRGLDLDGDGQISAFEGGVFFTPDLPIGARDTLRQTALDMMQLVRALQMGMDLDGDGTTDLDGNNIHFFGQSLGTGTGVLLHAIEPTLQTAALTAGPGSVVEAGRLGTFRPLLQLYLGSRQPSLLNAGTDFNENLPWRWEAVRVNDVPGAIEIQDLLDRLDWIEIPGAPHAFAPHLKSSPLAGVQYKPTLLQFAWGDQTVPNPQNSLLIRSADAWETSIVYRADKAHAIAASLPVNPHTFLFGFDSLTALSVSLAAQQQISGFMLSYGRTIPDPNSIVQPIFKVNLFEPATLDLELPNVIPANAPAP